MDITLKNKIMRRVFALYLLKKAVNPMALQTYLLAFLTWQLFLYVSMPHVIANAPNILHGRAFMEFYFQSFLRTQFIVQVLAVGILSLVIWIARQVFYSLKRGSITSRMLTTQHI